MSKHEYRVTDSAGNQVAGPYYNIANAKAEADKIAARTGSAHHVYSQRGTWQAIKRYTATAPRRR